MFSFYAFSPKFQSVHVYRITQKIRIVSIHQNADYPKQTSLDPGFLHLLMALHCQYLEKHTQKKKTLKEY